MSVHKVAQDVEAEDKLIGPFSFRQFIYLLIAAAALGLAWALWNLFQPLAIIPVPVALFFGALALPLRKDQPMETYLAAIISFYVKPRKRIWKPDGIEQTINITAPKEQEKQLTKNISQAEAHKRFSYLADIADSHGWSIRHSTMPPNSDTSMVDDVFNEARNTQDILDGSGSVAMQFETMINKADEKRHQEMVQRMQNPGSAPAQPVAPQPAATQTPASVPSSPGIAPPAVKFNPYPNMHQHVLQPSQPAQAVPTPQAPQPTTPPAAPKQTTSKTPPSADIIDLANNDDLSVEAIEREANRRQDKAENEVYISLH